ncbi:hypothetical protein AB835_07480 [Candidatus Endobugula sertula]|uniref:diguanylate cyclase n=1 Tax=Candidatus Endobugula sertula TaxID=62101 RepID=A0A1D2QQ71_9GAMM|nr:hypothetical protein AB835_07480 [Candidatus Endobugula sertula]
MHELLEQQQESSIQLKLTSLLQTTLKLEPLMELFFGQVQHLLKIHSCHYSHQKKLIDIQLGKVNTHTADYSLNLENHYLGNIIFSRKQRFTEAELLQIESLLGILVYPLRNALNYRDAIQQALHDPLTGLGNRGALEHTINHQWQMSQRYEQHFSVLMIDIDYFKRVNDTYGHAVGDKVLKEVAKTITTTTRQTDLSYRYGGEEFLVILNKSQPLGAGIIAERIRENISTLDIAVDDTGLNTIKVTASVGGSTSHETDSSQTLMQQADEALYYAKKTGRDRVEFFKK